jgi:hypothetical protein
MLLTALERNSSLEVEFHCTFEACTSVGETVWQAPSSVVPFIEMAHPRVQVVDLHK